MNERIWLELPADQIYKPVLRQGLEVNLEVAGFVRLHYLEVRQEVYANRRTEYDVFYFERRNARWMAEMLRIFENWDTFWIDDKTLTAGGDTLGLSDHGADKPMTVYLTNVRVEYVDKRPLQFDLPRRMAGMLSDALLTIVEDEAYARGISTAAPLALAAVKAAPVHVFNEHAYAASNFGTAQWRELTKEQKTQALVPSASYVGVGCGVAGDGELEVLEYQIGGNSVHSGVGHGGSAASQCLRCERNSLPWIVRTLRLVLSTKEWMPLRTFWHVGWWDRLRIERTNNGILIKNQPRASAPYAVPAGAACERDEEYYELWLQFTVAEVLIELLQQQMEDNPALRPWWKRAFSR